VDALIDAAARALAAGDAFGALKRVALRDDAPALALRGIAMAQLGDLARARSLLRDAARAFGAAAAVPRARCIVAEAEVAFASRDLGWSPAALDDARATLEAHGDRANAAHARHLEARRLLLLGRVDDAEGALDTIDARDVARLPPALRAVHHLTLAGIAMRRLRAREAHAALERAHEAAREAGIPALGAEVEEAWRTLRAPAARIVGHGDDRSLLLGDVEALLASRALVVDACREAVRDEAAMVSLATRPVLFALARALGEAWPGDVPRDALIARAFGSRFTDASHRARLRVEVARLRTALRGIAGVVATARGFALAPRRASEVVVIALPVEDEHARLVALLADGESWSSSALALALGTSQRTVQRALDDLAASGRVQSYGRGRARRWITPPVPGFATPLLLPQLAADGLT
jgi:tetratricopeptide (TPR) repeat protein